MRWQFQIEQRARESAENERLARHAAAHRLHPAKGILISLALVAGLIAGMIGAMLVQWLHR